MMYKTITLDPDVVLGERLAKVWNVIEYETSYDYWDQWVFKADLPCDARLHAQHTRRDTQLFIRFDVEGLRLSWTRRETIYVGTYELCPKKEELAAQWLPTFRRGVWLSGAQIDCSATERAAWCDWARWQGIEKEELERWDLQF